MTRFDWFRCCGAEGVELGGVHEKVYARFIRYSVYLDFKAQGHNNSTSITLAADRIGCDDRTIYRAIEFFDMDVSKENETSL